MLIMLLRSSLFLATLVLAVWTMPLSYRSSYVLERRGCGTVISDEHRLEFEDTLNQFRFSNSGLDIRELVNGTDGLKPVSFDVYWHIVYANETMEGGYVGDERIADQMKVMNDDFKSANISWNFKNITRIENPDWFINVWPGSPQEQEMKKTYHKGDSTVLNIFTAQFNATTKSLGFASLPTSYLRDPLSDGLIIRHSTLPGGSHENYNHGRTTVHELGHWLGLYHTFEGGCDGVGDNIADTAPEASEAVGCPIGRRSCPKSQEDDPIHNFMDYSWDTCMTHFTPGQGVRMHEVIWAYRTKRPPVANSTTSALPSSTATGAAETSSVAVLPEETDGDGTSTDSSDANGLPDEEEGDSEE